MMIGAPASITTMAPAANAWMPPVRFAEAPSSSTKPARAATAETAATAAHRLMIQRVE